MKTDILTYLVKTTTSQRVINALAILAIFSCWSKIRCMDYEIKALKTRAESDTEGETE